MGKHMANKNKSKESHPIREALRDFGTLALLLGALVIGAEILVD